MRRQGKGQWTNGLQEAETWELGIENWSDWEAGRERVRAQVRCPDREQNPLSITGSG